MKQVYESPSITVISISSESLMLTMSVSDPDLIIDGDVTINTRDEQLIGGRRGRWGNLWDNE